MDRSRLFFFLCLMDFPGFYVSIQCSQDVDFWKDALSVMSFHRNKMNEYLCKNYLASEIIESYKNNSDEVFRHSMYDFEKPLKNSRLARESLLADPGSQKYKDWLSRSSTLEDIYRQFEHPDKDHTIHQEPGGGHEGEVTGYALVGQKQFYSKPVDYGEGITMKTNQFVASHVELVPKEQGLLLLLSRATAIQLLMFHIVLDLHYPGHYKEEDDEDNDEHHDKGLKLQELFHFALTAIAFLAFACFMIEVIMSLMDVPQPMEPDYVLVPTTTGGTGPASKLVTENPDQVRQERSLNLDPISLEVLNAMSSKVLSSIEALTLLHEGDDRCLKRSLCQNSKYAKSLKGIQKIWLPLWSFGTSWVGERLSLKNSTKRSNTLEFLKAAVMGFGNTECHVLYPHCDERKRRRKLRK